jgi:DNA-binding FrmR family transcriptional regulator
MVEQDKSKVTASLIQGKNVEVNLQVRAKKTVKAKTEQKVLKHADNLKRLARIRGQIEGIDRMLREARYCPEILQQVKSVSSAIKGLECSVLEGHLRGCVKQAFNSKDPFESEQKIAELIDLMKSR